MIKVQKTKILETVLKGVDPFQPMEFIDITKDMVGYRIRFVYPKPKVKPTLKYRIWQWFGYHGLFQINWAFSKWMHGDKK